MGISAPSSVSVFGPPFDPARSPCDQSSLRRDILPEGQREGRSTSVPNLCFTVFNRSSVDEGDRDPRVLHLPSGMHAQSIGSASIVGNSGGGGSAFFDIIVSTQPAGAGKCLMYTVYIVDWNRSGAAQVVKAMELSNLQPIAPQQRIDSDQTAGGVYISFGVPAGTSLRFRMEAAYNDELRLADPAVATAVFIDRVDCNSDYN